MERAVPRLNDAWIMKRARLRSGGLDFQMPLPLPGLPLILGDLDSQAVPTSLSVVADEKPMPVAQANDLRARSGIGQVRIAHRTPGFAPVIGLALMQPLGRRAIIPHEREERA